MIEHPQLSDERRERIAALQREVDATTSQRKWLTVERRDVVALLDLLASPAVSREPEATPVCVYCGDPESSHPTFGQFACDTFEASQPSPASPSPGAAALAQATAPETFFPERPEPSVQERKALSERVHDAFSIGPAEMFRSAQNTIGQQTVCPACCLEDPRLRFCHVHAQQIPADPSSSREEPPSRADGEK